VGYFALDTAVLAESSILISVIVVQSRGDPDQVSTLLATWHICLQRVTRVLKDLLDLTP
jgi:hypothetical protein